MADAVRMGVLVPLSMHVTPPTFRGLSPEQMEKTRKSAEDFEALAIGQMLQPMFRTVDTGKGMFGGGKGEQAWKPLLVDEMAKMLAKNGGIGLADSVYREMLRLQEPETRQEPK